MRIPFTVAVALLATSCALAQRSTPPSSGKTDGKTCAAADMDPAKTELLHKVAPHYPKHARNAKIEGSVVLWVMIGKDGKIKSVKPQSGPEELIPAAMKAVKQWRYAPFHCNGEIVEVETDIHVNFQLSD